MHRDLCNDLLHDLENDRLVLPTLPEVALRVRDAVDNEHSTLREVTGIITTDAALSARLVQVANSPLMRASRSIDTVDDAVNWLGLKLVREMATSMVMEQLFQATSDVTDRKLRRVWEHSTLVAAISHTLANQFTRLSPQQALLAGLVHRIGVLPILTRLEDHPELLGDEKALDEVIDAVQGEIGEAILRKWRFPDELVMVPRAHEDLSRDSNSVDYADIVTVANLQSLEGSQHPLATVDWNAIPAFSKLGLSPELNVIEMDETAEDIAQAQRMLQRDG